MLVDDPTLTAEQRLEILEEHLLASLRSDPIEVPDDVLDNGDLVKFCRDYLASQNKAS